MIDNNNEEIEKGYYIQRLITKLIVLSPPSFGTKSDYEMISKFKNKLIFIEKNSNNNIEDNYIPCLFYRNPTSSNYLIYFHGNSEHIFQIEYYGLDFRSYLDMNVIIVEYPGYSIYNSKIIDSKTIFSNALIVYDWVQKKFNIKDEQIFVCGRSLGTSSAIYLSSKRNPKALFLMSAFTSIKNIGKDYHASIFLEEIFNSYRYVTNIRCPILFIHGKKDSLIGYNHSIELYKDIKKNNNSVELRLNENMTHNDFSLKEDIIYPIKDFIDKYKLRTNLSNKDFSESELKDLYKMPLSITQRIESKLFNINDFQIGKKLEIKNAYFFMKSNDNNIIFGADKKILMLNQRNYALEEEIKINTNELGEEIKSIFQMDDKRIICGTNLGNIFIYSKNSVFEENNKDNFDDLEEEEDEYKEIKHISLQGEIYKIDKFLPNKICVLSINSLQLYDENFIEKNIIPLKQLYTNFVQISDGKLAMLSYDHIAIFQIKQNQLEEINRFKNIESNNFKNILIATNKYVIVGGKNCIYFIDYNDNKNSLPKYFINKEITFIYKIHDEFFLASTKDGTIIQININNNKDNIIDIQEKKLINRQINSVYLKNFKTFIFTDDNNIQIWNIPRTEKNTDESCKIF